MNTYTDIHQQLHDQYFSTKVSQRYHAHRIDALTWTSNILQGIELIFSTGGAITAFNANLSWTQSLILVAAISSGLSAVSRINKRIQWHYDKKARFAELATLFPALLEEGTQENLIKIKAMREDIEKDDTKGFKCLDAVCYNEECHARGYPKEHFAPLTKYQSTLGLLFPLPYHEKEK